MHATRKKHSKLLLVAGIITVALLAFAALELTGTTHVIRKQPASVTTNEDKTAKTTSKAPTAQSNFTGGDNKNDNASSNTDNSSANITDTSGQSATSTNKSAKSVTSSTGQITLNTPASGSTISNGQIISGTSTLSAVSYRIGSTSTGMIAQGQLKVVNGKFSGTLSINTTATQVQLDVYGTQSDGDEFSNISIPLKLR